MLIVLLAAGQAGPSPPTTECTAAASLAQSFGANINLAGPAQDCCSTNTGIVDCSLGPKKTTILTGLHFTNTGNTLLTGSFSDQTVITSLKNLVNLNVLDIQNQNLNGDLSSLLLVPTLTTIKLSGNQFTGSIPAFSNNIVILSLSSNQLSGSIPTLPNQLTTLELDSNQLTGAVPNLPSSLLTLKLNNNLLTLVGNFAAGGLLSKSTCDISYNHISNFAGSQWAGNCLYNQIQNKISSQQTFSSTSKTASQGMLTNVSQTSSPTTTGLLSSTFLTTFVKVTLSVKGTPIGPTLYTSDSLVNTDSKKQRARVSVYSVVPLITDYHLVNTTNNTYTNLFLTTISNNEQVQNPSMSASHDSTALILILIAIACVLLVAYTLLVMKHKKEDKSDLKSTFSSVRGFIGIKKRRSFSESSRHIFE